MINRLMVPKKKFRKLMDPELSRPTVMVLAETIVSDHSMLTLDEDIPFHYDSEWYMQVGDHVAHEDLECLSAPPKGVPDEFKVATLLGFDGKMYIEYSYFLEEFKPKTKVNN